MAKTKEIRTRVEAPKKTPAAPAGIGKATSSGAAAEKISKTVRKNLHLRQFQDPIVRTLAEVLGAVSDVEKRGIRDIFGG